MPRISLLYGRNSVVKVLRDCQSPARPTGRRAALRVRPEGTAHLRLGFILHLLGVFCGIESFVVVSSLRGQYGAGHLRQLGAVGRRGFCRWPRQARGLGRLPWVVEAGAAVVGQPPSYHTISYFTKRQGGQSDKPSASRRERPRLRYSIVVVRSQAQGAPSSFPQQ